jgi:hypothetical protein
LDDLNNDFSAPTRGNLKTKNSQGLWKSKHSCFMGPTAQELLELQNLIFPNKMKEELKTHLLTVKPADISQLSTSTLAGFLTSRLYIGE